MIATYEYHFKRPQLRTEIDLRKHARTIVNSVECILPDAVVEVKARYFKYTDFDVDNGERRAIGKLIAKDPELGKYVKEVYYGDDLQCRSGQLFILKKMIVLNDDDASVS